MPKLLKNSTIVAAALAATAMGCSINGYQGNGDDNFFSAFSAFEDAEWYYARPLEFTVDTLADSICPRGDLLLTLRHTDGYEYRNLWLEVNYDAEDENSHPDTLNIILADIYGHWRGSGSGNSFQITDTIRHDMPMRRGQHIALRHIMRTDTLANIEHAGITYLPAE